MLTLNGFPFVEYSSHATTSAQAKTNAADFYKLMNQRRSVRHFSDKPVDRCIIDDVIRTASTAPSGAHKQPWMFCVVENIEIKKQIREAAEKEEFESYNGRMSNDWLQDIAPLQTDWHKPFLETAPFLIVVFKKAFEVSPTGDKKNNYYVTESVGLACGLLLAAIHYAGLAALTHTPSPMNFLTRILARPENERPFLLIPVGYPAEKCHVPDLKRKALEDVAHYY